jgi:hypothetical protein
MEKNDNITNDTEMTDSDESYTSISSIEYEFKNDYKEKNYFDYINKFYNIDKEGNVISSKVKSKCKCIYIKLGDKKLFYPFVNNYYHKFKKYELKEVNFWKGLIDILYKNYYINNCNIIKIDFKLLNKKKVITITNNKEFYYFIKKYSIFSLKNKTKIFSIQKINDFYEINENANYKFINLINKLIKKNKIKNKKDDFEEEFEDKFKDEFEEKKDISKDKIKEIFKYKYILQEKYISKDENEEEKYISKDENEEEKYISKNEIEEYEEDFYYVKEEYRYIDFYYYMDEYFNIKTPTDYIYFELGNKKHIFPYIIKYKKFEIVYFWKGLIDLLYKNSYISNKNITSIHIKFLNKEKVITNNKEFCDLIKLYSNFEGQKITIQKINGRNINTKSKFLRLKCKLKKIIKCFS